MAFLSRTKIKKEIESVKKAIETLKETKQKCEDGLLVNEIVLKAFEDALIRLG